MLADRPVPTDPCPAEDRMVAARYFAREPEARVYAARLKALGIRCYLTNTYALTALPLAGSGIGLHVCEADLPDALHVFRQMERESQKALLEQSFHDADLEDIEYQRALHRHRLSLTDKLLLSLVVLLILAFLARPVLTGLGQAGLGY